jgi:drug/metabolite transporter (DMT)-like permease
MMSRQSRAVRTFSYPVTLVLAVFVLIWSTGFIVARYGMPYSLPQKFLAMRYAISDGCLLVWTIVAGAIWPMNRTQWMHLCGRWRPDAGNLLGRRMGSSESRNGCVGLASLLVGLQAVLTAIWVSGRGGQAGAARWAGLAVGLAGALLMVWPKWHLGELNNRNLACAIMASLAITVGTFYQKHLLRQFAWLD